MLNGALARRYAQALFDIATETSLDKVEQELRDVTELIQENPEVAHVLYHPHVSLTTKKSIMDQLLKGQIGETVRHFLYLLIDRRRQILLPLIQTEFSRMADQARRVVEARVASATELTPDQQERLKQKLVKLTGQDVRLVTEVRPELIGGVLVQIGDKVMDGSVVHALNRMREDLRKAGGKVPQEIGVR